MSWRGRNSNGLDFAGSAEHFGCLRSFILDFWERNFILGFLEEDFFLVELAGDGGRIVTSLVLDWVVGGVTITEGRGFLDSLTLGLFSCFFDL